MRRPRKLVQQPDYVIDIIRRSDSDTGWYLYRKILFERVNLVPHHQIIYDTAGEIATDVTYQVYQGLQRGQLSHGD